MRSAALEHDDVVPGAGQLLSGREACGPRADDRHTPAGEHRRWYGPENRVFPSPLGDLVLDLLDRHRRLVDTEDTRGLAWGRAEPAGELREVVRRVQPVDRRFPLPAVHEVVPLGDQVPERAPGVAERDAAVHAACALGADLLLGEALVDLLPVAQAHRDRTPAGCLPLELHEPGRLAHGSSLTHFLAQARRCSRSCRSFAGELAPLAARAPTSSLSHLMLGRRP